MAMSLFRWLKSHLRNLATEQPRMGECLAAGSGGMQPVSCWKFIQIKALLTIALTNEWMAANKVYSRCFWQYLYSTALCSQYFMAVYWEDREHIAITWCSCTKSLLKHSHNQNKVLELSEFQPVPLFWPEFWSFSAFHHFLYPHLYTYAEKLSTFSLSFSTIWQCQPTGTSL